MKTKFIILIIIMAAINWMLYINKKNISKEKNRVEAIEK